MKIKVEIIVPIFRCEADKRIFFSRLYELKGFESLAAKDTKWYLELKVRSVDDSVSELQEICDMWHADFNVLIQDNGVR